jgi:hypothetical protein
MRAAGRLRDDVQMSDEASINNEQKKRPGRPFVKGDPRAGRPQGSRNKSALMAEAMFDGAAEKLIQKVIERALDGDSVAMRIAMDRVVAPRKDRPVKFLIPSLEKAEDAHTAMAAITAAVAAGELSFSEAESAGRLVESFVRALEAGEHEQRLRVLEEQAQK